MPDLRVSLGSLTLANPVLVAAGTYGYGTECAKVVALERLGAIVTKTLTRSPRDGHPPPRLVETPSGMLNAVGLQNVGLDAFLKDKLPSLQPFRVPIIVSVLGESTDEIALMVRPLDRAAGVAAIELNLSCPNFGSSSRLKAQGSRPALEPPALSLQPMMVAQDADATAAIVRAARQATAKPIIAKLSPDVTDLAPIAQAAERAGADALTVGNTFVGMSIDPAARRSRLGTMTGGLSGPAIRPLAVYRVWYTARHVTIPIIGAGGIVRPEDALEFLLAGASGVAVGTANFVDPRAPLHVLHGIERYLTRHRIPSVQALRGAMGVA